MQEESYEGFKADSWLAGFIDGEGCFFITRSGNHFSPRFCLGQSVRWRTLMEAIQREMGGGLSGERRPSSATARPTICWTVGSKQDLATLVAYLDEFPLRGKRREYQVWRECVEIYAHDGGRAPFLRLAQAELRTLKGTHSSPIGRKPDLARHERLIAMAKDGMTNREIAAREGCAPGTVGAMLHKLRGSGYDVPYRVHPLKTHCIHGHPFSGENLRIGANGRRICRACSRALEAKRSHRHK